MEAMSNQIQNLGLFADGISRLFHPFAEVVIHHLNKNQIAYIAGLQSPRKVGDPSYLSKADRSLSRGIYGPYSKVGANGKSMKSISIVFQGETKDRYMICINFDISEFQHIQSFITTLTSLSSVMPQEHYFDENWQDKIHKFVNEILIEKGLTLNQLTRDDKRNLVFTLRDKGAFNGKNAAAYIAQLLKVSRASIYGYLKEQ
jgi:predicted transcriptional regulator YheO